VRPILFRIPGLDIPIFAYGFMIMVGFLVGIFFATRRARKVGMDPNNILDMGIYLVVFGVIGARLFFIIQFSDKFNFQILNIFDGSFSIIGVLAGGVIGAALYIYRKNIRLLARFHKKSINTTVFFIVVALVAAMVLGRVLYVALTPSATRIVAILQKRSDFYPDSFRKESFVDPETRVPDKRILRITGDLRTPGDSFGKPAVHAYEFAPANEKTGPTGFTYEGAADWLRRHSVFYEELRPAYDLMLFEIWKGGLVYYGGVIGAVGAVLFFAFKRKLKFWQLGDICAPSVALGLACGRIGCLLNGC
jgi:prolipoprotein diacylglyceryltransferase